MLVDVDVVAPAFFSSPERLDNSLLSSDVRSITGLMSCFFATRGVILFDILRETKLLALRFSPEDEDENVFRFNHACCNFGGEDAAVAPPDEPDTFPVTRGSSPSSSVNSMISQDVLLSFLFAGGTVNLKSSWCIRQMSVDFRFFKSSLLV